MLVNMLGNNFLSTCLGPLPHPAPCFRTHDFRCSEFCQWPPVEKLKNVLKVLREKRKAITHGKALEVYPSTTRTVFL